MESSKDDINSRNSDLTKSSFIMELFDLVNSHSGASSSMKLAVNLAVLEIIAYSVMVVNTDPQHTDYSLPKPWTRYGFGVYRMTITRRSLGTTMAYQEQRDVINDPVSFTYTNRIDTPMDVFLDPAAVLAQYHAQQS